MMICKAEPDDEGLFDFDFVEVQGGPCPIESAKILEDKKANDDACAKSFKEIKADIKSLENTLKRQTAIIQKLLPKDHIILQTRSFFPIKNDEELERFDKLISDENRESFLKEMRRILGLRVEKTLRNVLDDGIVLNYNVDGLLGKKRLKNFTNFYYLLLEAIEETKTETAEQKLRKAVQMQKKRHFRRVSMAKKASSLKEEAAKANMNNDYDLFQML